MTVLAYVLISAAVASVLYAYVGYPTLLWLATRRRVGPPLPEPRVWPSISISVPVYNEEKQIRPLLDRLLELDYPAERRQIVVVSDASTDATDAIVREYEARGVELVRLPERRGKTAAENAIRYLLRGDVVVNTDASVRIDRAALKPLMLHFADPSVGVASGRDVSVTPGEVDGNAGESRYVGYEMGVRALETRVRGIVGASGCFYAIRKHLHQQPLPDSLSRDFAAPLTAAEHGFRSVSVDEAVCYVPRTMSLQREYRRKVRTMTRGMGTLWYKRALLNPLRYPVFAWMLLSHKICRWLVPLTAVGALIGLALLAPSRPWALAALLVALVGLGLGAIGWRLGASRTVVPRWLAIPAYVLVGNLAALHAFLRSLRGAQSPVWEPTRREVVVAR